MQLERLYQLQRKAIAASQDQPHNILLYELRTEIDRLVRDAEREAALAKPITAKHHRVPHRAGTTIDADVEYTQPTQRRLPSNG